MPGRLLVRFADSVSDVQASAIAVAMGGKKQSKVGATGVHIVDLPAQANEAAYLHAFRNRPDVEFAEFDLILPHAATVPNDPYYPTYQLHLPQIQAPQAWDIQTGSASVVIAILDTGVDATHPDLAAKITPGWNIYNNNGDTADVYGHGTAVAGTAAAISNNGAGVAAPCWRCLIMPVRISDASGSATLSNIATGLTWAADHGARVANISYQVSESSTVKTAAQYFWNKGGVVASSAGNAATFITAADNPYIVTVGAVDSSGALYSWSNTGNIIDLVAPGCLSASTDRGGGYGGHCGTSFSSPLVAGVAGLLFSARPGALPADIVSWLRGGAADLGTAGWDTTFGAGLLNAYAAVKLAGGQTGDTTPPAVNFTSPAPGATLSGTVTVSINATDAVGVASTLIALPGGQTCATVSCAWNTSTIANGSYTLTATARDAAGNQGTASVTVSVSNNTPPAVAFITPGAGTQVKGTVTVSISATGKQPISSVKINLPGGQSCSTTSCLWNSATSPLGPQTLTATATDTAGLQSSVNLTVTVVDSTPPVVALTSPLAGSSVTGNVTVTASATDNVGVTKVELYVRGTLAATSTAAPWTTKFNARKFSAGAASLQLKAYDAAGNSAVSALVGVTLR
ncbi:MAG: S8 family serine peptidase [Acidobacteria bacterium]|nr:S8 family serine peptidase [Acidobacteriota bacterium]